MARKIIIMGSSMHIFHLLVKPEINLIQEFRVGNYNLRERFDYSLARLLSIVVMPKLHKKLACSGF